MNLPLTFCRLTTLAIMLMVYAAPSSAVTFTKLLDTSTDYAGIGQYSGFTEVAFDGTNVAVIGQTGTGEGIYQWNAGSLSVIADASTYAPGLNDAAFTDFYKLDMDAGNIAFLASSTAGATNYQGAYTTLGCPLRRVADTTTNIPDYSKPFTNFSSGYDIAIDGQDIVFSALSFQAPVADGVYAQSGNGPLTRIVQNGTVYSHADVEVSDGRATFYTGFGPDHSSNSFSAADLATPDDRTLLLYPARFLPGMTNPFHVNRTNQHTIDHGDIAFVADDKNFVPALYLQQPDGHRVTIADRSIYDADGHKIHWISQTVSLDNRKVAFTADPLTARNTLYIGNPVELIPIIRENSRLDGKTVSSWTISQSSLKGESVAFTVKFSDNTQAVYIATLDTPLPLQFNAAVEAQAERFGAVPYQITDGTQTISVQQIPYLQRDKRAIMEFALDRLPEHAVITRATLRLIATSVSGNGPPVTVAVYAGDGEISAEDALRDAIVAGSRQSFSLGNAAGIGLNPEVIQSVLYQSDFIGLLAFVVDGKDTDGVAWAASEVMPTYAPPRFEFEYILMPDPLLGDANNDGIVNGADYVAIETWFGSLGAANGLLPGDANDDGRVDGNDWLFVERYFGDTLDGGPATPEPGTGIIVLLLIGGLAARTRPLSCRWQ